jgi:hypothetical protein
MLSVWVFRAPFDMLPHADLEGVQEGDGVQAPPPPGEDAQTACPFAAGEDTTVACLLLVVSGVDDEGVVDSSASALRLP